MWRVVIKYRDYIGNKTPNDSRWHCHLLSTLWTFCIWKTSSDVSFLVTLFPYFLFLWFRWTRRLRTMSMLLVICIRFRTCLIVFRYMISEYKESKLCSTDRKFYSLFCVWLLFFCRSLKCKSILCPYYN